ncbi:MAG: Smr/MutS family protein [Bacilli bacterium]
MNLDDVIFINNLPTLDLHGVSREIGRVFVNDFIADNKFLKNDLVVIIHGFGSGILKTMVRKTLQENHNVLFFKTHFNNAGCTIVKIKIP